MPYVAKIGVYHKECQEIADNVYEGITLTPAQSVAGRST
jgi:hypothetical protein